MDLLLNGASMVNGQWSMVNAQWSSMVFLLISSDVAEEKISYERFGSLLSLCWLVHSPPFLASFGGLSANRWVRKKVDPCPDTPGGWVPGEALDAEPKRPKIQRGGLSRIGIGSPRVPGTEGTSGEEGVTDNEV